MIPRLVRLWSAFQRASERQASLFAAGVAFFVFLSIFPALIAGVFAYGLFADATTIARHGERLAHLLPADAGSIVLGQLRVLTETSPKSLGGGALTAVLIGLWSASRGVNSLMSAVQWMFGTENGTTGLRRRVLATALTAGSIVFVIVALGLIAALPAVLSVLHLEGAWRLLKMGRWVFLGLLLIASIGGLFQLARKKPFSIRAFGSGGVLVASVLWILVSLGFSTYVDGFAAYDKTYGALAGVVVFMLWLWLCTFAVLFGAAFEWAGEDEFEAAGELPPS